jgi:methionyl-tRNA synthetase
MISYEEFSKLEIRIGEIKAVEVVENADKLLKLAVDVGETESDGVTLRPRQIISGIREFFDDPQELVGKQCPFLTNLEPRVIRGLESQGMILAAKSEDTFALFLPSNSLPPGTRVS